MHHKTWPGLFIAGLVFTFIVTAVSALLFYPLDINISVLFVDAYYRHITAFSFYQAFLSTLLSVGLAIPVSHALSRRHFFGKSLLLKLFATTLVLPVLVGVFGILAIYGNSGLLASLLQHIDQRLPFSIYGLNGILLAHLFFNLPFATRLLLQSLHSIPIQQHKLAAHLGLFNWQKFRIVEWPTMRQQLPHVAGLVFMLCFTSFATVMALGGGPKSTTIELAIYQAIKFDFDLQAGALLALWQILLCSVILLFVQRISRPLPLSNRGDNLAIQLFNDTCSSKYWDRFWIVAVILLVVPPLLMVVISGLNHQILHVISDTQFWKALFNSLIIALFAAFLALFAATFILICSRFWRTRGLNKRADKIEMIASLILVTPGIVISTGLFLLLRNSSDMFSLAIIVVMLVNALMALPYALKTLAQPMFQIAQQYDMLCASLGIDGWSRFKIIEWRAIKRPFIHAFSISFVLSIGDLSAIALFGSQDFKTLPLYLLQLLGSYQMQSAAVIALFLLLISVGVFSVIEKLSLKK
ncbi:thiamine/thiamine pyrophosphate ABC transporter permease ThiP [Psychromonas sp. MME2]|uniref:thiamine/thiamine pyrophosphate ABC transporter permease ThiP n=1 Tax=Psychromonas sp. MME2 TaxID=3231033 RepID=UPI00339CF1E6